MNSELSIKIFMSPCRGGEGGEGEKEREKVGEGEGGEEGGVEEGEGEGSRLKVAERTFFCLCV